MSQTHASTHEVPGTNTVWDISWQPLSWRCRMKGAKSYGLRCTDKNNYGVMFTNICCPLCDPSIFQNAWMLLNHFYHKLNFNSLVPRRCSCNFKLVIFKHISRIDILRISFEIALIWMSQYLTDDQSTLVQVMAWCHQATSHYLSKCWPRSLTPYDVTGHNDTGWGLDKVAAICRLHF